MIADGFAARPGVYTYRNPDGSTRRELVEPVTLLRSDTLRGKPVTLHHPAGQRVTPDNAGEVMTGSVSGVDIDEPTGMMRVELTVVRADAIAAIQAGTVELSPGYSVTLDNTPGTHATYGDYDAVQVARSYNHLAICDTARGGSRMRIRTDAAVELDDLFKDDKTMKLSPALLLLLTALDVRADSIDEDDFDAPPGLTLRRSLTTPTPIRARSSLFVPTLRPTPISSKSALRTSRLVQVLSH